MVTCGRLTKRVIWFLGLGLLVAGSGSADVILEGPEIQLHVDTSHAQATPRVASQGAGTFVVGWVNVRMDGGQNRDIFVRKFDANGLPLTGEIPATVISDRGTSFLHSLESDAAGDFIIAFTDQLTCCDFPALAFYKRFDADGFPKENSRPLREGGLPDTFITSLAVASDGSALLGWGFTFESGPAAYSRFVDAAGIEDPADTLLAMAETGPIFAAVPGGGFLRYLLGEATWLAADGTITGPTTPITFGGTGSVGSLRVEVLASGNGLFVWSVWDTGADTSEIFGRRLAPDGTFLGPEFPLLDAPIPWFTRVDADVLPNGDFVVVWDQAAVSGGPKNIYARQFQADGTPLSDATLVNPSDFGDEQRPHVAATGGEGVVVVWENWDGQDGDEMGVYGQRLRLTLTPLFADGFESGDTTAWTASTP